MKKATWHGSVLLLLAGLAGAVQAQGCDAGNRLSAAQIRTLLNGNTICVASASGWESQEQHRASGGGLATSAMTSGDLWDYRRGPGDATDPSTKVGSWTVSSLSLGSSAGVGGSVTYSYGTAGSGVYSVHGSGAVGSPHAFCGPVIVSALIKAGQGGC
ncbi:MAG: hypothetical protein RJA36_2934 [Pseudomonadota bacterium]|jgi:hypothetical protein